MASTAECVCLLEAIHDRIETQWPTQELAAAKTLIDSHHVTPARAAHLLDLAMKDGFHRGKVKTALALLKAHDQLAALDAPLLRRGVQEPVGDAYKKYRPPPPDEAKPYHTWGDDRLGGLTPEQKADFIARRDRWAAKIDRAVEAGYTGPAIGRACGVNIGAVAGALVQDANGRDPVPGSLPDLLKKAKETSREAREAAEQLARLNAAHQAKQMAPPAEPPAETEPSPGDLLRAWADMTPEGESGMEDV
jgi:hypothetical protein